MSDHCGNAQRRNSSWGQLLRDELVCHLPCAIFSVAVCLVVLSIFSSAISATSVGGCGDSCGDRLFHSFHFIHIVFAATSTMVTYFRFSRNLIMGIALGVLSPMVFCTLSDVLLPYVVGEMLGGHMHLHVCFFDEIYNVLPFLIVGIINGCVVGLVQKGGTGWYLRLSHVSHILISSFASGFYLVSHGFHQWYDSMGLLFIFLIVAVVMPCTVSDVIVPMIFARGSTRVDKNT